MCWCVVTMFFFFFKQKTAYEMRISDWSSDVCSSDLFGQILRHPLGERRHQRAIALLRRLLRLMDQVVHLILHRLDLDRRVDKPGRADHLFGEGAAGDRKSAV